MGEQLCLPIDGQQPASDIDILTDAEVKVIKEHVRKPKNNKKDGQPGTPMFANNISVSILKIPNPEVENLKPDQYEVIGKQCKICNERTLVPTSHFMKAVKYAEARKAEMLVVLTNARLPLDSNEVERLQRTIAIGRKNMWGIATINQCFFAHFSKQKLTRNFPIFQAL